jgi:hypothetical protein
MKTYRHKQTGKTVILNEFEMYSVNGKHSGKSIDFVPKWVVENSSDWELVEEPKKDWKILSYSSPVTIKSIMRLSDGEVFSVGDYIEGHTNPITCIDVTSKSHELPFFHCGNYGTALLIANKRKALFTTEDGVDIKEGDRFWFIPQSHNNFTQIGKFIASKGVVAENAIARFSTENAAKEYIAYNKPRFSLNEIKNIRTEIGSFGGTLINKLEQIIKSEL